MKRRFFALLVGAFVVLTSYPGSGHAWVNHAKMNPHNTPFAATTQPEAVPVPGTNVYIAPDYDQDLIFYRDYWYRIKNGSWDMARDYNGPWTYIPVERVPVALLKLPADYRRLASTHVKIPYIQLKSNWKAWEEDGRWERHAVKELHRYYRGVRHENASEARSEH